MLENLFLYGYATFYLYIEQKIQIKGTKWQVTFGMLIHPLYLFFISL